MCYNAEMSRNAFLIGLASCIVLFVKGTKEQKGGRLQPYIAADRDHDAPKITVELGKPGCEGRGQPRKLDAELRIGRNDC